MSLPVQCDHQKFKTTDLKFITLDSSKEIVAKSKIIPKTTKYELIVIKPSKTR